MSVFYHNNNDPLLYQTPSFTLFQDNPATNPPQINDAYAQLYKQQLLQEMQQRQQQMGSGQDWLGDLDKRMKELDPSIVDILSQNTEFTQLNAQLQGLVQSEIMALVKTKVNTIPSAIDNVKRQLEIIKIADSQIKETERKNINELNDYMKNYSHLTFDEYRKLKNGETNPTPTVEEFSKNKKTKK